MILLSDELPSNLRTLKAPTAEELVQQTVYQYQKKERKQQLSTEIHDPQEEPESS